MEKCELMLQCFATDEAAMEIIWPDANKPENTSVPTYEVQSLAFARRRFSFSSFRLSSACCRASFFAFFIALRRSR